VAGSGGRALLETCVAGDVEVQILLNVGRNSKLAKIFNRENEIQKPIS